MQVFSIQLGIVRLALLLGVSLYIGGSGGIITDSLPFPLSTRATYIRAMAQNTRARSANGDDRVGQGQEVPLPGQPDVHAELFRELIQELRRDRQRPQLPQQPVPQQQENFKAPEFNGTGSVEVFIRQFLDVAEANTWGERATVLHLRRALKEEARDCAGASNTMAEIFTALRARYGISPREARVRINSTRKENNVPLQTHANTMRELVGIAYPGMPEEVHEQMALDQFVNTLNNPRLQEHLLAIRPDSLTEAVTAGNEFLQVRQTQLRAKQLEVEEEGESRVMPMQAPPPVPAPASLPAVCGVASPVSPVATQPTQVPSTPTVGQSALAMTAGIPGLGNVMTGVPDPMMALMAAVTQLAQGFSALQQSINEKKSSGPERRPPQCWNCGKIGHLQSKCHQPKKVQGNQQGQQ